MIEIIIGSFIGSGIGLFILLRSYPFWKARGFVHAKTAREKAAAPKEVAKVKEQEKYLPFFYCMGAVGVVLAWSSNDFLKNSILALSGSFIVVLIGGIFLLDVYIRKSR